jgi:hypothetical protein
MPPPWCCSGSSDYAELLAAIPEASELAPSRYDPASGLPGFLKRGGLGISGRRGAALGLLARLESAGLTVAQGGTFTALFLDYVRRQAGADMVAFIAGPIPELRSFL